MTSVVLSDVAKAGMDSGLSGRLRRPGELFQETAYPLPRGCVPRNSFPIQRDENIVVANLNPVDATLGLDFHANVTAASHTQRGIQVLGIDHRVPGTGQLNLKLFLMVPVAKDLGRSRPCGGGRDNRRGRDGRRKLGAQIPIVLALIST